MNAPPLRLAALGALMLAANLLAADPTQAQFVLRADVVASGGTDASSGAHTLLGTVGQAAAVFSAGTSHTVGAGFWYRVVALDATPAALVEALAPLALTLTPMGLPGVARGEPVPLTATFAVGLNGPSSFEYWAVATLPDGRLFGPVLGPSTALVTPGTTVALAFQQTVPPSALPGAYTYTLYVGTYSTAVLASDAFAVTVAPPSAAASLGRLIAQDDVAQDGRTQERLAPSDVVLDDAVQDGVASRTRSLERPIVSAATRSRAVSGALRLDDASRLGVTRDLDDRWLAYDGEGRLLVPGSVIDLRSVAEEVQVAEGATAADPTADSAEAPPASSATGTALPTEVALAPPYPNPSRQQATLRFALPEAQHVRLVVYDALGRAVAVLVASVQEAGHHEAVLDGRALPSGVYLVRMTTAGGFVQTHRMTLLH